MLPEVQFYFDTNAEAGRAYEIASDAAYNAYDEAVRPVWKTYYEKMENAGDHVFGAPGETNVKCPACEAKENAVVDRDADTTVAETHLQAARSAAGAALTSAGREAMAALVGSSDPVVRYIAENCQAVMGYAEHILRVLPGDLDAVRRVARDRGWCAEYWGGYDEIGWERRAIDAGLFPEPTVKGSVARYGYGSEPCDCSACRADRNVEEIREISNL